MQETLIPIALFLGGFALIFGMRYLANKERMAMIERGMNPGITQRRSRPLATLKSGLIFLGAGIGLAIAYYLDTYVLNDRDNPALYFALIAIFGGLGLVISYIFEKRHEDKEKENVIR